MAVDLNWGLLAQPNRIAENALLGYEAGRKERDQRQVKNALALADSDPRGSVNALMALGRPDLASNVTTMTNTRRTQDAQEAGRDLAAAGDYQGAAKAAAPFDLTVARQFSTYGKEQLDQKRVAGERSAAIIMAASRLGSPEERRTFIGSHADELAGLGYTPDQVAGYDVSNPTRMRADAARFLSLADIAGKVSTEKFGDYAVTYQTDPINGTREISRQEIPETRADRLARDKYDHDVANDRERLTLDRSREGRMQQNADNPESSPSTVMGPIYAKLARGEDLTPGERQALQYYKLDPITADAVGDLDEEPTPPPAPTGRRQPAPRTASAAPPPAALQQLKEGANTTFSNGQVWTLRGGTPQRVK